MSHIAIEENGKTIRIGITNVDFDKAHIGYVFPWSVRPDGKLDTPVVVKRLRVMRIGSNTVYVRIL